jgi:hypothetical protein
LEYSTARLSNPVSIYNNLYRLLPSIFGHESRMA